MKEYRQKEHRGFEQMKKNTVTAIIGVLIFALTFRYAQAFSQGVTVGLKNCAAVIIPSLFPFMAAASFLGYAELPQGLKRIVSPITRLLFGQPPESLAAIISGFFGGYPSGAKAAVSLYESGKISREDAGRLTLFCVNGGAGFCVNAVGTVLLGSEKAGQVIFASMCIAAIITGIMTRKGRVSVPDSYETSDKNFSQIFVDSVASASKGILTVCAYTALFSGVLSVISQFGLGRESVSFVACLLEVASGCAEIAGEAPIPVIASVCAFGGICVHMQIFSVADKLGISIVRFYFFRVIHSLLSGIICALLLKVFPVVCETSVSFSDNAAAWSFSAPAAISLILLASMLILELDKERKIC